MTGLWCNDLHWSGGTSRCWLPIRSLSRRSAPRSCMRTPLPPRPRLSSWWATPKDLRLADLQALEDALMERDSCPGITDLTEVDPSRYTENRVPLGVLEKQFADVIVKMKRKRSEVAGKRVKKETAEKETKAEDKPIKRKAAKAMTRKVKSPAYDDSDDDLATPVPKPRAASKRTRRPPIPEPESDSAGTPDSAAQFPSIKQRIAKATLELDSKTEEYATPVQTRPRALRTRASTMMTAMTAMAMILDTRPPKVDGVCLTSVKSASQHNSLLSVIAEEAPSRRSVSPTNRIRLTVVAQVPFAVTTSTGMPHRRGGRRLILCGIGGLTAPHVPEMWEGVPPPRTHCLGRHIPDTADPCPGEDPGPHPPIAWRDAIRVARSDNHTRSARAVQDGSESLPVAPSTREPTPPATIPPTQQNPLDPSVQLRGPDLLPAVA
ncbi:hypothetical protein J8273_6586 [Carpediemonas membranifera]|uniref:Uncharacterized protein n=1 Tax=Carpediemonas membranifera TaxID=201153 RepID=A0A8J6E2E5_9EUKA|nr:hypothetical protein J8273_6586 [Carpediemonas membranifera]|eukprot:KAG9391807.1 hypothetical protein J8273_6586 [Carpediemonas membranifera]